MSCPTDMRRVHCGEPLAERPVAVEQVVGVHRCAARHCSFSAGCSLTWACRTAAASPSPCRRRSTSTRVDAAHRVDRRADLRSCAVGQTVDARGPRIDVAVAEPLLRGVERGITGHAARQVARVEQGDANAGRRGRRRAAPGPSRWRSRVRHAAAIVVEIVELADAREAGQHHLGERRRGQTHGTSRGRADRRARTSVAPRPERTASRHACDRAALGGTHGCGRWPFPAASGRRAVGHSGDARHATSTR